MEEIRLITYNIDGLPEQLDLNDLPWVFKPAAWIYKLINKTTVIPVNDGNNHSAEISEYLKTTGADLIGVQEDFNYHKELMSSLKGYNSTTHTGDISLSKLFSKTEWWSYFPFPRFKADGLNLLYKTDKIKVLDEDIVWWKKSAGYFKHANDKLTHKGFRYYSILVSDKYAIDMYIVHMDADFYNPETCPDVSKDIEARKAQYKQLEEYITAKNSNNPIIIAGDFNNTDMDFIGEEVKSINSNDVDRVFIINNNKDYKIVPKVGYSDDIYLSDHKPYIVDL